MDENKSYSVVGTVTIGTDEYRDLIQGLCEAKADASKKSTDWYKEYNRANDLEKKCKELETKYNELREFVASDDAIATKLKLFRLEKQEAND